MRRWTLAMGVVVAAAALLAVRPLAAQSSADTAQPAVLADEAPAGAEIAANEPPAPIQERAGRAPSRAHIWVGGYWRLRARRWAWMRGRWAVPPRGLHAWMPGHWVRFRRGWYWVGGHWR